MSWGLRASFPCPTQLYMVANKDISLSRELLADYGDKWWKVTKGNKAIDESA